MTKDEALKMAIDFLDGSYEAHKVRKACQESLEQPAQENCAHIGMNKCTYKNVCKHCTHPHQWQGLTDDEILKASSYIDMLGNIDDDVIKFARAIEQAHGIGVKDADMD